MGICDCQGLVKMDFKKLHIIFFHGLSLREVLTWFVFLTLWDTTLGELRMSSNTLNLKDRKSMRGGDPCPYSNTCANRKCYSNEEQCNGKDDCGDGSDEWECDILDRLSKSGSAEVAWPWWILILSALFILMTCLAIVCRYLRERTDPALDTYLLDSPPPRRGASRLTSHDNPHHIELRDAAERRHSNRRKTEGRQQNHQKQVPPPLPPPPRLAQNPAQSTLVSDAVITSPPQHLDDAVALDIEPLPPPPQPTRAAPPVPQSPPAPAAAANKRRSRRSRTPENLIDHVSEHPERTRSRPEATPRNRQVSVAIPIVPPPPTTPSRPQRNQSQNPQQAALPQQQQSQQQPVQQNPLQNDLATPPPAYEDLHFDGYRTLQVDQSSAAARGLSAYAESLDGEEMDYTTRSSTL